MSKDYEKTKELTRLRNSCFMNVESKSQSELKTALALYLPKSQTSGDAKKERDAMRNKVNRAIENLLGFSLIRFEETDDGPIYYAIRGTFSQWTG